MNHPEHAPKSQEPESADTQPAGCCSTSELAVCCEPSAKGACCGPQAADDAEKAPAACGCR
jgi:hypothetical protein